MVTIILQYLVQLPLFHQVKINIIYSIDLKYISIFVLTNIYLRPDNEVK
jgi:hypothetical protein